METNCQTAIKSFGELWILLCYLRNFCWWIELCIDRALSMNSPHRIPIQQGTQAFFHTIEGWLVIPRIKGKSECMQERVKAVFKNARNVRFWQEQLSHVKLLSAVPVTAPVQESFRPKFRNAECGKSRNRGKMPGWSGSPDRRIVNNLHDFCGAGGRTLSAWMQGLSGKAS